MAETDSHAPITRATGIPWEQWVSVLDAQQARTMDHTAIAALVVERMPEIPSKHWWAQSVAIAYEQHVGIRVVGQSCDGTFAANASKTVEGSLDEVIVRWQEFVGSPEELDGVPTTSAPSVSSTEKWRYWRVTLADGSKVNVNLSAKSPEKAVLGLQHAQLNTEDDRERWRAFWKRLLTTFK